MGRAGIEPATLGLKGGLGISVALDVPGSNRSKAAICA
jgi:hypothetical protein